MADMDVIRAFLDGKELNEAALRTNGKQLFSDGRLIGEKRGTKIHVVENMTGAADTEQRRQLLDFAEWREQRAKVLRRLLNTRELLAVARANAGQPFRARSQPARPRGEA